jgi:hypothetical protein
MYRLPMYVMTEQKITLGDPNKQARYLSTPGAPKIIIP